MRMLKFLKLSLLPLFCLQLFVGYFFFLPPQAYADDNCRDVGPVLVLSGGNDSPVNLLAEEDYVFEVRGLTAGTQYSLVFQTDRIDGPFRKEYSITANSNATPTVRFPQPGPTDNYDYTMEAILDDENGRVCNFPIIGVDYNDSQDAPESANCRFTIINNNDKDANEYKNQCKDRSSRYKVTITNATNGQSGTPLEGNYKLELEGIQTQITFSNGTSNEVLTNSASSFPAHYFILRRLADSSEICRSATFPVIESCQNQQADGETTTFKLCAQISDDALREKCQDCAGIDESDAKGIWTAVGCIDRDPQNIIAHLITIGLGMGGGVSLLMILAASFILTTSQGEPKRTGEAKEMVTAAIVGLVFVIFSVTILQFIGVTILRIPGFGG